MMLMSSTFYDTFNNGDDDDDDDDGNNKNSNMHFCPAWAVVMDDGYTAHQLIIAAL